MCNGFESSLDDPIWNSDTILQNDWFAASFDIETIIPVQDIVHEGTKLRTRFLKRDKILPFGDKIASPRIWTA